MQTIRHPSLLPRSPKARSAPSPNRSALCAAVMALIVYKLGVDSAELLRMNNGRVMPTKQVTAELPGNWMRSLPPDKGGR
jgi:hypothetical protein